MTPQARVQAAIEILDAVIAAARSKGAPADRIVSDWFRTRRYAGSKDRRAVRELVYAAILPGLGLGVCVKAEDGTSRAAQVAVGQVLEELGVLTSEEKRMLADRLTPPVINRAGLEVGRIRPAVDVAF